MVDKSYNSIPLLFEKFFSSSNYGKRYLNMYAAHRQTSVREKEIVGKKEPINFAHCQKLLISQ